MGDSIYKSPPQLAARYGCKPETIRDFIKRGDLEAVNLGTKSRPRYRISPDAILKFEQRRSGKLPAKPSRKKRKAPDIIEFY